MTAVTKKDQLLLYVGVLGIFVLLVGVMGYAVWGSGGQYDLERIDQFVQEQTSAESH